MKILKKSLPLVLIVIIISILLAGCSTGGVSATSWPGITASEDTAYVAYTTSVMAVRISDSTMLWRYPEKANAKVVFYAAPVLSQDGSLVIIGDYANNLYALDARTGAERWKFSQAKGRYVGSPLVLENAIFAPNADHSVYALDLQGGFKWSFETDGAVWATPLSDGETIFIASMDHSLYAISQANGNLSWKVDLGGAIVSTPVLSPEGVLFAATLGNEIIAVDGTDGKILWRFATSDAVWGTPILMDGILYFGDLTGSIYALDITSQTTVWKLDAGDTIAGSTILIPAGLLFPTENGNLLAVSTSGEKIWTRTLEGKVYSSVASNADRILVGLTKGDSLMVALDMNGNNVWSFSPPK